MKSNFFQQLLALVAIILFSSCGESGGGSSLAVPPPAAIDISHDGTGGLTFGKSITDQLRRYQTFIADSHPSVTGVEVKIRKNNGTDYYNSVSVELYETDAQHKPSTLLAMSSFTSDTITAAYSVIYAPVSYHGLVSGKEYAVVLEQYNAFGADAGFEWCSKQVNADYFFGKYDNGVWGDESSLGDGWLKVYVDSSSGTNPVPGSLDTSFGTGGTTTAPIGFYSPLLRSITIQPDGKIVAAGYSSSGGSTSFALARYNADGSLDTTLNSTGTVTTSIGTSSGAIAVALQPDGKIVAAGYSSSYIGDSFALARYNADGSLDTTLNSTGTVTTSIGTSSGAIAVALQPDGKIVAAGYSSSYIGDSFALARYNTNGSLDTTLNSTGTVTTAIGTSSGARAVAVQPDGKIVAAGSSDANTAVARYHQ